MEKSAKILELHAGTAPPAPPSPDDRLEARRRRGREYYRKNRDRICTQQRERYRQMDKAAHAARIREYRRRNHEKVCAQRREYRARNREAFLERDRRYRAANREKVLACARQYWWANRDRLTALKRTYNAEHREQRLAYYAANRDRIREQQRLYREKNRAEILQKKRAYYLKNRESLLRKRREMPPEAREAARERWRRYYEKNRYTLCRKKLDEQCYRSIQDIRARCPERVQEYLSRYPFEQYARRQIERELAWRGISPAREVYMECYDAGMLAYLYSIHRCALMACGYTEYYIRKMIRILILCALVVSAEVGNLCRQNNLTEWRLDREDVPQIC